MDIEFDAIDPKKEERGAWDFVDDVTEVRVRRANYEPFRARLAVLREEVTQQLKLEDEEDIPAKEAREILVTAISEELLTDWRGMMSGGEELKFCQEESMKLLGDPRHSQFLGQVLLKSNDMELFRVKRRVELGKS